MGAPEGTRSDGSQRLARVQAANSSGPPPALRDAQGEDFRTTSKNALPSVTVWGNVRPSHSDESTADVYQPKPCPPAAAAANTASSAQGAGGFTSFVETLRHRANEPSTKTNTEEASDLRGAGDEMN